MELSNEHQKHTFISFNFFFIRSQIIIGEEISERGPPPAFTFILYQRTEP